MQKYQLHNSSLSEAVDYIYNYNPFLPYNFVKLQQILKSLNEKELEEVDTLARFLSDDAMQRLVDVFTQCSLFYNTKSFSYILSFHYNFKIIQAVIADVVSAARVQSVNLQTECNPHVIPTYQLFQNSTFGLASFFQPADEIKTQTYQTFFDNKAPNPFMP